MAWVLDPARLVRDLDSLRRAILADPYFKGVPSLLPENKKTALMFHAKDDLPEVRREVFRVLMRHPIQFFAVVRDKLTVVDQVRARNAKDSSYRYHQHELYDSMMRQMLVGRLHRDQEYVIQFARRGRSDRTEAIRLAVEGARQRFQQKWGIVSDAPITARAAYPQDVVCLQASDYLLWALQRLYEKGEERYVSAIWPAVRLIHDVDDTRDAVYGRYYTQQKNRLDGNAIGERSRRI
jgi:hypothetical protein